jgi:N-acetylglucosaminyl-diphospho-decaprenol L-rhamnosyltransferase
VSRSSRQMVDVGVVSWNTAQLTATALRRLIDSDQGCDIRLLVRDNGSTDGTVETLSRLVPEAEIDAGTENLGFGAGANRLFERAEAPWFFLLNSDAWPEPGAIGCLVEAARRYPSAAAIAPRLERPDGTLEHSTYPFPSLRLAWLLAFRAQHIDAERGDRLLLEGSWMHDRPRSVDWAVGAALLIPREVIRDVGGFDERFFMYAEDLEWCWRASRRGLTIRFEPSAVVRHVGNASGEQNYGALRTTAYLRNTYRFFRREHGLAASIAYRGLNLAGVSRLYLRARRGGNHSEARYWRNHIRGHLTPAMGSDHQPRSSARSRTTNEEARPT